MHAPEFRPSGRIGPFWTLGAHVGPYDDDDYDDPDDHHGDDDHDDHEDHEVYMYKLPINRTAAATCRKSALRGRPKRLQPGNIRGFLGTFGDSGCWVNY